MLDVEENIGERSIYYVSRLVHMRKSVCSEFLGAPRGVFLRFPQNHPQMLLAISACVLGYQG